MEWMLWGLLIATVCVLAAAVPNGFVAPLKLHFRTNLMTKAAPPPMDATTGPFFGLALSGGGAAAGAAGMKALHDRGLLAAVPIAFNVIFRGKPTAPCTG